MKAIRREDNMITKVTNHDRAMWAMNAVAAYTTVTRSRDDAEKVARYLDAAELDALGADWGVELIGDLVCDLLHLAEANGIAADEVIRHGRMHYEAERNGEDE